MKKITIILFIALTVLGNLPIVTMANMASEILSLVGASTFGGYYRIYAKETDKFRGFLYECHTDILVIDDGSTGLDLYVYDDVGNRIASKGNSDGEKICLNPIYGRRYFTVKVVNRGNYVNDYKLISK